MVTFLLEVGTEELPASFVGEALEQWRSRIPASLSEQFLTSDRIEFYGTPRRLSMVIQGLPVQQPDRQEEIKGPSAQAAYKDGQPTKALQGFARSRGISIDDVEIRTTEKGDFVFVQQTIPGRPTADLLTELIPNWILKLEGRRFMRWGDGDLRFPRPIRWLVALLDDAVLPLTLDNASEHCSSDRLSQGHRVLHPEPVVIPTAADYLSCLAAASVQVAVSDRRQTIEQSIHDLAASLGGTALVNPSLLAEVTDLVEWPTAIAGSFDPAFLELPPEVIITEMESHQRYFPVLKAAGSSDLLPYFITISNGDPAKSAIISAGNERVLRARLSDGKFFFDADRTQPLEAYLPRLDSVTFQEDLGSVREKVNRITRIADAIADQLDLAKGDRAEVQRIALLCKADLVTQMVGEFPELQGVMGSHYAIASGESPAVAQGIMEHYRPKGAGDALPTSLTGQVVGLSDRLDTLVCIFGLGLLPSGSSDPFALRRAANAIVHITWGAELPIQLNSLLEQISADFAASFQRDHAATLLSQLQDFFLQRVRTLLQDDLGIDYDLVNAVLGEGDADYGDRALSNLLDLRDRAQFLQTIRQNHTLDAIYETVNRAARLAAQGDLDTTSLDPQDWVNPKFFQQPSETAFYEALVTLLPTTQTALAERDYQRLVDALTEIAPVVRDFFDGPTSVLVMDPDASIQQNRLNLLGLLRNHARVLADFGAIIKPA
ncbi:MAG: glycine--tRNA ligase subunit beta [Synechococcales cyanobacterium K44_A2020_017]|nr:glycine--tRNA ligase subunit beta [Synechococcales cyanobacterium K32_A2020_035]MBF2096248.1 glycine--tRNA ligase subunit beta [Synechococcales cyanobacterium K44_A2020_017]